MSAFICTGVYTVFVYFKYKEFQFMESIVISVCDIFYFQLSIYFDLKIKNPWTIISEALAQGILGNNIVFATTVLTGFLIMTL